MQKGNKVEGINKINESHHNQKNITRLSIFPCDVTIKYEGTGETQLSELKLTATNLTAELTKLVEIKLVEKKLVKTKPVMKLVELN